MAQTGQRVDPYRNFNFLVELDGIAQAQARFTECTGLGSTTEVIEIREGGDNTTVRKLPGKTSYSDITLKYGVTDSTDAVGVAPADHRRQGRAQERRASSSSTSPTAPRSHAGTSSAHGRPSARARVQRQGQRHRRRHPRARARGHLRA